MIHAGPNDGQPQCRVDTCIKIQGLERDQTLIVVHANVAVGLLSTPLNKARVGGNRAFDIDSFFHRQLHRRFDHLFFLVIAKQTVLARVRIQTQRNQLRRTTEVSL